jgi:flagellar hook-associated protein 3 FlgL
MRISTTQIYGATIAAINDQQSQMARLQQQISTGKGLLTASDDPVGAAQAVQLTISSSTLTQYQTNQQAATSSLQAEDGTLQSVQTLTGSIQQLLVKGGDASLNDSQRTQIAQELQSYRDQLMTLANSTDGQGNYLFSGFQVNTPPFANAASGAGAVYNGDAGQRAVQVSDSRTLPTSDTGSAVFMSVMPGASTAVSSAASTNTGAAVVGAVATTNAADPTNAHNWVISFQVSGTPTTPGSTDGLTITYTTQDMVGGTPPGTPAPASQPQAYTAGAAITVGGQSVTVSGVPANGDSFNVTPAAQSGTNIFTTLDTAIAALKVSAASSAGNAALTNALTTANAKVQNFSNNVLATRASVGGREQEVTALSTAAQTTSTQYQSQLQAITSVDWVGAVSQLKLAQTVLQGAEQAFTISQNLSLFNLIK